MGVGIFGGTFDPIHVGHLRAAEEVREFFSLDRVYFVPANIPPHKERGDVTSGEHRARMVRMAVRGNRFLRVSETEIRRGGISYSIDTVGLFAKRHGDLYWLVGIDAFLEVGTWHRYDELFWLTNFIVMWRPHPTKVFSTDQFPKRIRGDVRAVGDHTFEHVSGKRVYLQAITQIDISASTIRERRGQERSIKYLVPPSVERYIAERGLYRTR
jgi:nicotinate-nucleotide adenylyltransferase